MKLLAAPERDAVGLAVSDQDAINLGVCANHRALRLGRTRQSVADGAHPAAYESPQTSRSRSAAHHVMEQNVSGAWRRGAPVCSDHAVSRQSRFNLTRLKTLVKEIPHALGHALIAEFERPQSEFPQRGQVAEPPPHDIGRRFE